MSGSWEAMLEDEARRPGVSLLERRRQLSRLPKAELIDRLVAAEFAMQDPEAPSLDLGLTIGGVPAEHEIRRQDHE